MIVRGFLHADTSTSSGFSTGGANMAVLMWNNIVYGWTSVTGNNWDGWYSAGNTSIYSHTAFNNDRVWSYYSIY